MSSERNLMIVKEAAEQLGMTPRRVLQLLATGELSGERITPRLWLVDRKSVETKKREPLPTTGRPRKILKDLSKSH